VRQLTDQEIRQLHRQFKSGGASDWMGRYTSSLKRWHRISTAALGSPRGQETLWYGDGEHDTGGVGVLCPSVQPAAFRDSKLVSLVSRIRDLPKGRDAELRARATQDLFEEIQNRMRLRGHGRRGSKRKVPTARIVRALARLAPWTVGCLYGPESRHVVVRRLVSGSRGVGDVGRLVLAVDRVNRVLGAARPSDHRELARRSTFLWFLYEQWRPRHPSRPSRSRKRRTGTGKEPTAQVKRVESSGEFARAYRYTLERQSVRARAIERRLVQQFIDWRFEQQGESFASFLIPTGAGAPAILCDAYDEKSCVLVEAKAGVSRPMVRMALGQLLDYAACMTCALGSRPRLRLLVPRELPADLERIVRENGVGVIWRAHRAFEERPPLRPRLTRPK
jgi:hypothetical protein